MKARKGKGLGLYPVLWIAFTAFAAAIVGVSAILQFALVEKRYREEAGNLLKEAAQEALASETEAGELTEEAAAAIASPRELSAYFVFGDTREVVSCTGEDRTFQSLEWLENSLGEDGTTGVLSLDGELGYGVAVNSEDGACTLFFSFSFSSARAFRSGLKWTAVISAVFSFFLAIAVSAAVAALISRPITEVTERARRLARGDYAVRPVKSSRFLEMRELSESIEYARVEISKADSVQRELIANVSHDFKTPLTAIKAYASMIKEISGDDKEKREAHAQIIIDEADRLAALVADVLDLSRLRAGVTDKSTVFNLSETAYAIAERFFYLREKGYLIETEIEEELYCFADRVRIEQVAYNLISNAVNYTGEDKRVRVKLFKEGEAARFEVIDSGKGIPPDEVDHIWDRYYRSSETHKRPVQGTGLGLSIVKSILLAYNIPFGVVSEVGKGSCFWVEFPAPPQEGDKEEKA